MSRLLTDVEAKKVVDDYIAGDWATRIITTGRGHWEYLVEPLCRAQAAKTRAETLKECEKWLDSVGTGVCLPRRAIELLRRGIPPWEVK